MPVAMQCRICGEGPFPSLTTIRAHHREAHPRPAGGAIPSASPAPPRSHHKRIEDASGAPRPASGHGAVPAETPGPGGPGSPEDSRSDDEPIERSRARLAPSRPQVAAPVVRLSPELRAQSTADAVRDALPVPLLADLVGGLFRALSEADGAGEAGYLSPIQCTQVAVLLHDATVDFVVQRFGGNVTRFKAALAVVVILASKGVVHARAIGVRARAGNPAAPLRTPIAPPVEDDAVRVYREAMARQQAMTAGIE